MSFMRTLAGSAAARQGAAEKAKVYAKGQAVEWKHWWQKNWEEANRVEPPAVTRAREERRRRHAEERLYGPKDVHELKDLPIDDMRRYGFVIGKEGGSVQSGYNRFDGVPRMTTAHDHSFEALDDRWNAMFSGGGRTDGGPVPGYAGPQMSKTGPGGYTHEAHFAARARGAGQAPGPEMGETRAQQQRRYGASSANPADSNELPRNWMWKNPWDDGTGPR
jgi:hypothetical protein